MEMTKKKCLQCGLINFSTDMECRRCGSFLRSPIAAHSAGEQKKFTLSSGLSALIVFLLIAVGVWYWSSGTNSNQPVLKAENLPEPKITPAPTPAPASPLGNIDPHDEQQIQKMIAPMDKEKIERVHEQERQTIEDLGKKVPKPFAQGPPQ